MHLDSLVSQSLGASRSKQKLPEASKQHELAVYCTQWQIAGVEEMPLPKGFDNRTALDADNSCRQPRTCNSAVKAVAGLFKALQTAGRISYLADFEVWASQISRQSNKGVEKMACRAAFISAMRSAALEGPISTSRLQNPPGDAIYKRPVLLER